MRCAPPHYAPWRGPADECPGSMCVREVPDILLRGQTDHDVQPVLCRDVEQGARRHGVGNADGVESACGHEPKVPVHDFKVVILSTLDIGTKGAVGDSPDVELLRSDRQELALFAWAHEPAGPAHRQGRRRWTPLRIDFKT